MGRGWATAQPRSCKGLDEMQRVLVCGDRDWTDGQLIAQYLEEIRPFVVIEGEARGADKLARRAAEFLRIAVLAFPADWEKYGKRAGPIRNRQMLKEGRPNLVLAFHDSIERSKGTKDMIRAAQSAGVPVRLITHNGEVEQEPVRPSRPRRGMLKQAWEDENGNPRERIHLG